MTVEEFNLPLWKRNKIKVLPKGATYFECPCCEIKIRVTRNDAILGTVSCPECGHNYEYGL